MYRSLTDEDRRQIELHLADMQAHGVRALRWWLFASGGTNPTFGDGWRVTGLAPKVVEDVVWVSRAADPPGPRRRVNRTPRTLPHALPLARPSPETPRSFVLCSCRECGLDPWGLIASGSLLIAVDPGEAHGLVDALAAERIAAALVGRATDRAGEVVVCDAQSVKPLPHFERDEIARLFD